MTNGVARI